MQPRVKKRKYEYRLRIYPDFHAESQRACVRFHFKTVEEFHHFSYRIDVEAARTNSELTFEIRGLKTTVDSMPASGEAQTSLAVFDLNGQYTVRIAKRGGATYTFPLKVSRGKVSIGTAEPELSPFVEVSTG